jgi:tetratricopeptide (TPR) repeat protein
MKLKVMGIALAALAVVGASGCSGQMQQLKAQADLAEASRDASIGQTAKAKQMVDAAILQAPNDLETYMNTPEGDAEDDEYSAALIFSEVGDDISEEHYLQQAISKFPKDYRPLDLLLQLQIRVGDRSGQIRTAKTLEQMIQARLNKGNLDAESLMTLADAEWQAGDRVRAVADFNRCMLLDSNYDETWNELAYDYACANDKPNLKIAAIDANVALTKARQAGEPDEDIGAIQDTLGWVEYRQGLYSAAMNDLDQAIDADPREPESRYHRAMVYLAEGNKPAAKAELQRALLLDPTCADAANAITQLANVVVQSPTVQAENDLAFATAGTGIDITSAGPAQPKPRGNP